jgi:hypothetical protein
MDAAAILKATTGHDAMIASDTRRKILDAVDANFDAQLATPTLSNEMDPGSAAHHAAKRSALRSIR